MIECSCVNFFDNVVNFLYCMICLYNVKEVKLNLIYFVVVKILIYMKEKVVDLVKFKKFREFLLINEVIKEIVECNKEENVFF